jgi:hypothetical protein
MRKTGEGDPPSWQPSYGVMCLVRVTLLVPPPATQPKATRLLFPRHAHSLRGAALSSRPVGQSQCLI